MLAICLHWWLVLSLVGWVCWPLLARVLQFLPDRGYAFARAFGLLLWGYLYWALGHLGAPLSNPVVWWSVAALVALLGLWGWVRGRRELGAVIQAQRRYILTAEVLFLLILALGVGYRAFDPAIRQAEQPVGLGFLSSILHNPSMPPADPWFAGMPIAYPYGGYLLAALPARAVGASAPVAYNVALAQTMALTALCAYGLIYDLLRADAHWGERAARRIAALGGALVTLMGNWEGVFEYMRARGVGEPSLYAWLDIPGLAEAPSVGGHLPAEADWWGRAARVLYDNTLAGATVALPTEFPAWSMLVGELLPRFLALPFLALAVAVALEILVSSSDLLDRWWRRPRFWAMAWVVGALAFLNPWCVLAAWVLLGASCLLGSGQWPEAVRAQAMRLRERHALQAREVANGVAATLALAGGALLLYLPFFLTSLGEPSRLALAHDASTSISHYLIVLGPWVVPLIGYALMSYGQMRQEATPVRRMSLVYLGLGLLVLLIVGAWIIGGWPQAVLKIYLAIRKGPWLLLVQIGLMALLLAGAARAYGHDRARLVRGQVLTHLLLAVGLGLTLVAEFYYVARGQDTRAETVSQLYYQAWLLLGVGAIVALAHLWQAAGRWRGVAMLAMLLLAAGLYYPVAAAYTKTGAFGGQPTLDGVAYLERESPGAYRVYLWLVERAAPGDVLVEAPGISLDASTSRMATLTGVPTILGWSEHEARWRGPQIVGQRLQDVNTIYRSRDEAEIFTLLARYGARYLYVGPREVEQYRLTESKLAWLGSLLRPVLLTEEHRLYRVP